MKKLIILITMFTFVGLAFAQTPTGKWENDEPENVDFNLSKNVYYYYDYDNATSAYYVLCTHHLQGNRVFATTNNESKIYYQEKDNAEIGKDDPSISLPAVSDNVTFDGNWKEL